MFMFWVRFFIVFINFMFEYLIRKLIVVLCVL